jgi:2'-5' RNA ligase
MRCFAAIELSPALRDSLLSAGARLREAAPEWAGEKWVAPANLHLTLAFFGDVDASVVADLIESLRRVARQSRPFELALKEVAAIPKPSRCSLVWARFEDVGGAATPLVRAVRAEAAQIGVDSGAKPFQAHVTLVRARHTKSVPEQALSCANATVKSPVQLLSVREVTLFSSTLTPTGPRYERLARIVLGQSEPA